MIKERFETIVRRLFAPITLRFQSIDSMLSAMDLLERSYRNPKCTVSKVELETAMFLIARELIRRKVVFWA
jgi:hypothetical protein